MVRRESAGCLEWRNQYWSDDDYVFGIYSKQCVGVVEDRMKNIMDSCIQFLVGAITLKVTEESILPMIREGRVKELSRRITMKRNPRTMRRVKRCCNLRMVNIEELI